MKWVLLILLFISLSFESTFAQWVKLYPNPGANLSSLCFTDANLGFSAGDNGVIVKTTNAGKSWIKLNTQIKNNLHSIVAFMSSNAETIVLAAGDQGAFLRSTDGGASWSNTNLSALLQSIAVIDDSTYVVAGGGGSNGNTGIIQKSKDEGKTWTTVEVPEMVFFEKLTSVGRDTLLASGLAVEGNRSVLRSTDGGASWSNVYSNSFGINDLQCVDDYCFASSGGNVARSTDAGKTWEEYPATLGLTTIEFTSDKVGYGAGFGTIYLTENGGETWIDQGYLGQEYFNDILYNSYSADLYVLAGLSKIIVKRALSDVKESDNLSSISIYPNPIHDHVSITMPNHDRYRVTFYNELGAWVMAASFTGKTGTLASNGLLPGLYQMLIEGTDTRISRRIIVQ